MIGLSPIRHAALWAANEVARIEIGSGEADGKQYYFVRDNGVGFEMKYSAKLFGIFQNLHPEAEYEGTGIGLAIAERIIKRHDGSIWAVKKPKTPCSQGVFWRRGRDANIIP